MLAPIYVTVSYPQAEEKIRKAEEKLKEARHNLMDLTRCQPTLHFVPAPDCDVMSVGGLAVYGVSRLSKPRREALQQYLEALQVTDVSLP